jgi:phosphate butyryltransferase
MHTGENIKKIRESREISRTSLAEEIGQDEEYVRQMEEEEVEAPVSVLLKIASVLDTDISALIYGKEFESKSVMVTDRNSRIKVDRKRAYDYENLAPYYSGRHMEPFLVDVYPATDENTLEFSSHEGEEFHYILEGRMRILVGGEEHILDPGDSIYFDSSLPHALASLSDRTRALVTIYHSDSMAHITRSKKMKELITAARHLGGMTVVVVVPNETAVEAVNRAMEEQIIREAFLVGDPDKFPPEYHHHADRFTIIEVKDGAEYEARCADRAVQLIREGRGHMMMKGNLNTAIFMKAVLNREKGIGTGRRLSLVSIFELPKLNRLIFLTDPGINPALTMENDIETSRDIILNAIDVARSMGVHKPKVAILDANEVPSEKIPTSIFAKELSEMDWGDAEVYGPLSYDLALYEEAAKHKGLTDMPVAGKADILIVPHISGGNFLYKAWAMTMSADVANVVLGAKVPLIITSRSDNDMTKFLTICASAVYSSYKME